MKDNKRSHKNELKRIGCDSVEFMDNVPTGKQAVGKSEISDLIKLPFDIMQMQPGTGSEIILYQI